MLSSTEMAIGRMCAAQVAAVMVYEQHKAIVVVSGVVAFRAIEPFVQRFPESMMARWYAQARVSDDEQLAFARHWVDWQDMLYGQGM